MRKVVLAVTREELEGAVAHIMKPTSGIQVVCVSNEPLKSCDIPSLDGVNAIILGERWAHRFIEVNNLAAGVSCGPAQSIRTILLADEVNSAVVHQALAFGVADVVARRQEPEPLLCDVRDAIDQTRLVCRDHIVRSVPVPEFLARGEIPLLSVTDHKIVGMIAAGYSDKEIAEVMHYSHQTIRNRVSHLLLQSGARNRTQLAVKYAAGGPSLHPVFG